MPKVPKYYVVFNYISETGKGVAWKIIEFAKPINSTENVNLLMQEAMKGTHYSRIVLQNWIKLED
jgi:hypothetical protein